MPQAAENADRVRSLTAYPIWADSHPQASQGALGDTPGRPASSLFSGQRLHPRLPPPPERFPLDAGRKQQTKRSAS